MNCPVCKDIPLVMSERQGVEFDYCPQCRGIWLDRGELDKIIEKSNGATQAQVRPAPASPPGHYHPKNDDSHYGHPYKKRSWLSDLFD